MNVTGNENYSVSYAYDPNNRLTRTLKTIGSAKEIDNFYYDYNGNQISKIHETISPSAGTEPKLGISLLGEGATDTLSEYRTYDVFNRMTSEMAGFGKAAYTYQPDNLRLSKNVNGTVSTHVWDGHDMIAEMNGSGTITGRYIRGGSRLVGKLDSGNAMQYYLYNGHGDVTGLTNSAGSMVKTYTYDAFGNELNKVATDTNPFRRYAGEYFDNETGNIYLRARYYEPYSGRFISADTHWNPQNMIYGDKKQKINKHQDILGSTIYTYVPDANAMRQGTNLYAYALNNPNKYLDSSGEFVFAIPAVYLIGAALIATTGMVAYSASTYPSTNSYSYPTGEGFLNRKVEVDELPSTYDDIGVPTDYGLNYVKQKKETTNKYKKPKSGTGKEKADDVSSWARGNKPYVNENGKEFARRLLNEKYGEGNWEGKPKRESEYKQIKKWGDRGFE